MGKYDDLLQVTSPEVPTGDAAQNKYADLILAAGGTGEKPSDTSETEKAVSKTAIAASTAPVERSQRPQGYVGRGEFAPEAGAASVPLVSRYSPAEKEGMEKDVKFLDTPLLPKEALPPYWYGKAAEKMGFPRTAGFLKGEAGLGSSITTPTNIAIAAATGGVGRAVPAVAKVGEVGLAAYFEAQAIKQFPEQWKQFQSTTNPEEKWQLGTQMAAGLGLPLSVVYHAATPKGVINASEIGKAETLPEHGVRPPVGQEAPLRQQGETPQAQAPTETPPTETILTKGGELPIEKENEVTQQEEIERQARPGQQGEQTPDKLVSEQPVLISPLGLASQKTVETAAPSLIEPENLTEGAVQPQNKVQHGEFKQEGYTAIDPQPALPAPESGISTERLQNIYGDDWVIVNKGRSAKEWKAVGEADKRDPYQVLNKSRQQGIAAPNDAPLLRAEHQRLLTRARQAYGTPEYPELAQRAVDFANATKQVVHGPASDLMRGLQETDTPKYNSPADFDNIIRERMNRESTVDETNTFKRISDEVRNGETKSRNDAVVAQNRLARYRPKDTVSFDDAVKFVKDQIVELTRDCNI